MTEQKRNEEECCLFKLNFVFDDRATAPWREHYLVTAETLECIENSWGPSAYLKFDAVNKCCEFKEKVFINSTFVVLFVAEKVEHER